jgi:hypothetical protein
MMKPFTKLLNAGLLSAMLMSSVAPAFAADVTSSYGRSLPDPDMPEWAWDTFKNRGTVDLDWWDRQNVGNTRTYTEVLEAFYEIVTDRRYLLNYIEPDYRMTDNRGERWEDGSGTPAFNTGTSYIVWKNPGMPIGGNDRLLVNIARAAINPYTRPQAGREWIQYFRVSNAECVVSHQASGGEIEGNGSFFDRLFGYRKDGLSPNLHNQYSGETGAQLTLNNKDFASYWCPSSRGKIREALMEYVKKDIGDNRGALPEMQYDNIQGAVGNTSSNVDITMQFDGKNLNQGLYTNENTRPIKGNTFTAPPEPPTTGGNDGGYLPGIVGDPINDIFDSLGIRLP